MALPKIRKILETISRGEGAYSQDQLTHDANCIESMKDLAKEGLANLDKMVVELEKLLDWLVKKDVTLPEKGCEQCDLLHYPVRRVQEVLETLK